ncbi:MAG: tetratricopeptide repeat protein [Anaerolineales bacterium]|nr:tetratricopeptide repeat protein [Anaerolineales bacterium]
MHNKKWVVPVIVSALLAAILLPLIYTGYAGIKKGEAEFVAQNYSSATESFEQAARLLIWRGDLWEKAGVAAGAAGNPSQAIIFLKRAPELSEQGWAVLGISYFDTGDIESALTAYQQGSELHDSASLYAGLAFIYRQQKNWLAESDALKNQVRLNTDDVYAHYRLGLLLSFLEPENALPELMLASSLDPETDPAVQTLRTALNLSATQTDPSQKLVTIGRALGLVQEWDLAISVFEQAIMLNAENAEAWAWLGEAKQQIGQGGLAELNRAVTLDHTSVIARGLRGLYWDRQKKYQQMLIEYLLAAQYEPENPAWQASIGDAYFKTSNLVAALTAYQHATELAPNEPTYWRLLAVFCAENGIHIEDVGLPAAQKAVELAPDDPFALDALGWSYLSSGRYASAEQTLLDVIARFPSHLPARIHLAMAYLAQGNQASAFNELNYVIDADAGGLDGLFAEQLIKQYFP